MHDFSPQYERTREAVDLRRDFFILVAALWVTAELNRSSWNTGQW